MKKLVILVLSIMLVAGSFTAVYATDGGMDSVRSAVEGSKVIIGGDARVRGICKINHDFDDDVDDDDCYWDSRVRLKITAKIVDGVEVRTRLTTGTDVWDGGNNTGGDISADYYYLHIPIAGIVIDAGRQPYSFGNKFLVWDTRRDRFAISGSGGALTVTAYADKLVEANGPEGFLDNDVDDYGASVVYVADDMEAGLIVMFTRDEIVDDNDGVYGSLYANLNLAGIAIMGEISAKGDDRYELTADEDTQWGGFLMGSMGMDAITAAAGIAFTTNGYVADTHFIPTLMQGTDQPAAISDFGALGDMITGVLRVDYAATPDLSVFGAVAYHDIDEYEGVTATCHGSEDECSAVELNAGLSYQIATNTAWHGDIAYLIPDDISDADDSAVSLTSRLQVHF
jgi:hypothetical protein